MTSVHSFIATAANQGSFARFPVDIRAVSPISDHCHNPLAHVDLGLLCSPMPLLWDVRCIWVNTAIHDGTASPGIMGNVFSQGISQPDTLKLHFTHIATMSEGISSRNSHIILVSSRGYKASQPETVRHVDAFSCTIPYSAGNGLPEMKTEN